MRYYTVIPCNYGKVTTVKRSSWMPTTEKNKIRLIVNSVLNDFKYIYQKYIYFWLIDILFSEVYTAVTIRNIYKLELDC